jgi:NTP pyrophosphatase (non-canonical NTP hydrolase)
MMDNEISIEELKTRIREFCEERDWDQFHSPKDLAIGLVTEASELLEHFRFRSEAEIAELLRDTPKRREVAHELADAFFFILRFSQRLGFDLSSCLDAKMAVNAERYPAHAARGSNRKYTELTQ